MHSLDLPDSSLLISAEMDANDEAYQLLVARRVDDFVKLVQEGGLDLNSTHGDVCVRACLSGSLSHALRVLIYER